MENESTPRNSATDDSSQQKNDETVIKPAELSDDHSVNSTHDDIINTSVDNTDHKNSSLDSGDIIDNRYRIVSLIGRGGLCEVYQAKDLILESEGIDASDVAIKVLQSNTFENPDYNDLLIKEAKQTQSLSHPNIVKVFGFGFDKFYYLVMELLDGETLEDIILRSRPNGLPPKKTLSLLKQIVSAFNYAHSMGVVHSDLKPSNIMLTRSGVIKIFDFGVARAQSLSVDKYASITHDESSIIAGYTPAYASPSLISGNSPSFQDDIYAFSCIAYELVTSKHPYNRTPSNQAQEQALKLTRPKQLPGYLWKVLFSGLQFNPSERLNSFAEIETLLTRKKSHFPVLVASLLVMAAAASYGYHSLNQARSGLQAQLTDIRNAQDHEEKLLALPVESLLKTLPTLPPESSVLKATLLRLNQDKAIDWYQDRIDSILNNSTNRYPDYYAIESIIKEALSLYPDSHSLNEMNKRITLSWQSSKSLIIDQINSILEAGSYFDPKIGQDITRLRTDLSQIDHNFDFKPSSAANSVFADQFRTAMNTLDSQRLKMLIAVGDTYFSEDEHNVALIAKGERLFNAVQSINRYHELKQSDNSIKFPYKAASDYYEIQFNAFNERLRNLKTVRQLQYLENDVNQVAKDVPADFSPLIKTQLAMAKRYIQFSDQFLNTRKQKAANTVMKRANALFAKIEASKKEQYDGRG
ncbi:serine/threonine-protein kinase [Photobacterium sp. TY1-4]|uniref:serine/threonine-protein kinase n=1 Tax=Photobacterium sp. TY1-4 TaxID=2899122 RepID=UPI0021BF0648|nr:serine/threonine-protein kinase [Photobacterium sp. TY1-4]UXI02677.1 serine/threonine protein kinase [Photobacterium sp. TY1-4]